MAHSAGGMIDRHAMNAPTRKNAATATAAKSQCRSLSRGSQASSSMRWPGRMRKRSSTVADSDCISSTSRGFNSGCAFNVASRRLRTSRVARSWNTARTSGSSASSSTQ